MLFLVIHVAQIFYIKLAASRLPFFRYPYSRLISGPIEKAIKSDLEVNNLTIHHDLVCIKTINILTLSPPANLTRFSS